MNALVARIVSLDDPGYNAMVAQIITWLILIYLLVKLLIVEMFCAVLFYNPLLIS